MKAVIKFSMWAAACLGLNAAAQQGSAQCEQAWATYNQFKSDTRMDPSQYPFTVEGAAVRAACGQEALPVPPGSDTPPMPIIRDFQKPPQPTHPIVLPPPTDLPGPPMPPRPPPRPTPIGN